MKPLPNYPPRKPMHLSESEELLSLLQAKGIKNKLVLKAIQNTPRHLFVSDTYQTSAYKDNALPIECGQTISQPYIVALMTSLLLEKKPHKVLEIGTGSGYQAAILGQLVSEVYSIERIETLSKQAKKRLDDLHLKNIQLACGDGTLGWPGYAPFDGIIVTAVASTLPENLVSQLKEGGRLVIPIGNTTSQFLYVVDKTKEGYQSQRLDAVRFVALVGG